MDRSVQIKIDLVPWLLIFVDFDLSNPLMCRQVKHQARQRDWTR